MAHFTVFDFFTLLCGIALFLYGMEQGEKNLKRLGGTRMRQIIAVITKHRLTAYIAGFLTTLVTQSSSATTVLLVGLASVKLMTLGQSLGVILGAGLGTAMTVQLFAFKFYVVSPLLIALGFAFTFARKSGGLVLFGKLLLAVGFVFYGMELMAGASGLLRTTDFVGYLLRESLTNPWIGFVAGLVLTAILQSSTATLAIMIAMASGFTFSGGGRPDLVNFLPVVFGANVGTCFTALLAILKAEEEGVMVAWAHLSFKILGTLLAVPFIWILPHVHFASRWPAAFQISGLHTMFNLYEAVFFLPLLPVFDKAIHTLVGRREKNLTPFQTHYLHEKVLPFPALALAQATKEISRMADIVTSMVENSLKLVERYNYSLSNTITGKDDEVDYLRDRIMEFLTRIVHEDIGHEEAERIHMLTMVTTDLEHVGDIVSKSIVVFAEKIDRSPVPLSDEGRKELLTFFKTTIGTFREALKGFAAYDVNLVRKIYDCRPGIKEQFTSLVDCHLNRLYSQNRDSLKTSSIHIDLLEEINRINHFTFRIVGHVLKIAGKQ
jgi:phosphate:Na+ symporter